MQVMALWNERTLPSPPISTYKAISNKIDLIYFSKICQDAKDFFTNNRYLYVEYLVLSRIIYRMKLKFRSSKDFKALEKVCKSLKLYFTINIPECLETILQLIPAKYEKETYLPSKNLLDYLLVRLQGVSKLLENVVYICKEAASLLNIRMKTGHFWKVGFITFSIISRVYVLAKHTISKICEFYGKLEPFSSKLQSTTRWLPVDYNLPTDLKKWLNIDWLELDSDIEIIDIPDLPEITQFFDLVDDEDVEFCDEYILIKDEIEELMDPKLKNTLRGFDVNNDVGEVINLDEPITSSEPCSSVNVSGKSNAKKKKQKGKAKKFLADVGTCGNIDIIDISDNTLPLDVDAFTTKESNIISSADKSTNKRKLNKMQRKNRKLLGKPSATGYKIGHIHSSNNIEMKMKKPKVPKTLSKMLKQHNLSGNITAEDLNISKKQLKKKSKNKKRKKQHN